MTEKLTEGLIKAPQRGSLLMRLFTEASDARTRASLAERALAMVHIAIQVGPHNKLVYIARKGRHDIVKIGCSANIKQRMAGLRRISGTKWSVLAVYPGGHALELVLQRLFADFAIEDEHLPELFRLDPEIQRFIDKSLCDAAVKEWQNVISAPPVPERTSNTSGLDVAQLCARLGGEQPLDPSTVWRRIRRDPDFPQPFYLWDSAPRFVEAEVDVYIARKFAEQDGPVRAAAQQGHVDRREQRLNAARAQGARPRQTRQGGGTMRPGEANGHDG